VRDLFEDENDPDAGQHSLDDARREIVSDDSGLEKGGDELDDTADDHRQEVNFEPERLDPRSHHHGKARGWSAHTVPRLAHERDHDAAGDTSDQPAEERSSRGERNPETKGQRHQEHDDPGTQVVR
jgi:hypothetical protein